MTVQSFIGRYFYRFSKKFSDGVSNIFFNISRCVDFWGEGKSFEIFEFNCPAHTFFDEKYSVCNYQNVAFPKCVESVSSRFIHPA